MQNVGFVDLLLSYLGNHDFKKLENLEIGTFIHDLLCKHCAYKMHV
jgi:hypothetical protein